MHLAMFREEETVLAEEECRAVKSTSIPFDDANVKEDAIFFRRVT
jgi:hypothetical protein